MVMYHSKPLYYLYTSTEFGVGFVVVVVFVLLILHVLFC